jgi:hypothetical protein
VDRPYQNELRRRVRDIAEYVEEVELHNAMRQLHSARPAAWSRVTNCLDAELSLVRRQRVSGHQRWRDGGGFWERRKGCSWLWTSLGGWV